MNSIDDATEYVGFMISPLIKCVTIVILFRTLQKIMTNITAFCAVLTFAVHPALNYTNMFGRPDHHAFMVLFLVYYICCLVEWIKSPDYHNGIARTKLAITTALCIWISPETLIFLLLTEGVLFFWAHIYERNLEEIYKKNMTVAAAIGIIVFLCCPFDWVDILCVLLLTALSYVVINNKYADWHLFAIGILTVSFSTLPQIEYDKISVVHVVLYMMASLCVGAVIEILKRNDKHPLLASLGVGLVICCTFLGLFPDFLQGMEAGVSEQLKNVWLHTNVDEMKSPFEFGKNPSLMFCLYLVLTTVALSHKMRDLLSSPPSPTDTFWWIILLNCACYMIFAIMADRMRSTLAFFSIPIVVDWVMNGSLLKKIHRCLPPMVACVLPLSLDLTSKYRPILSVYWENSDNFYNFCRQRKNIYQHEDRFFKWLDDISKTPATILTYLGKSSMTLYYTKHRVVAVPYHRQGQGILSFFTITESPYDEIVAGKILLETKTTHIFISRSVCYMNHASAGSLVSMIVEGQYPDWISIMDVPQEFEDVIIAKVNRSLLKRRLAGETLNDHQ
jgi:hypothetical protein